MTLSGEELFPPEQPKQPSRDILKILIPALGIGFTLLALLGFVMVLFLRPAAEQIETPNNVVDLFTYDIPAEFLVATDSSESEIQQLLNELEGGDTEPAADADVAGTDVADMPTETIDIPAEVGEADLLRWQRNRQPGPAVPNGFGKLVLIIDDMGVNGKVSADFLELPKEVTFSFLPYGKTSLALAKTSHANGHEVLVHIPMQAVARADGTEISPGPDALYAGMAADEALAITRKNMKNYLDLAVGANNHMGSAATADEDLMRVVLAEMVNDEMIFIDSITTNKTVVGKVAKEFPDLPLLKRQIFLDNVRMPEAIKKQLAKAIESAQEHGGAIAIGHPYPETLEVLKAELPNLSDQKVVLVPVSALVEAK